MTKNTKKAVWASALSIIMCLSLLIGTTFAWFTDTASTSVNKVQAGTLDVELQYEKTAGVWENAEGKTLQFKVNGQIPAEGTKILWEPGCTYELPALRVVNKGNLALKYKLVITGINGDAKLNDAIVWTMNDVALVNEYNGTMIPGTNGDVTEEMVIKGHMKEDAGNEYQGLSIDGVSVTVYATQLSHEQDSNGNGYDDNVDYNQRSATIMDNANGKTYTLEIGKTYTVGNGTVTVAANGDLTYKNVGAAQSVTITTNGGKLTVNAPNDTVYHYGESDFVDVTAIAGNSYHEFGKVSVLSVENGRVVAENGNNITLIQVKSETAIIAVPSNVVLVAKLEKASGVDEIKLQKGDDTPIIANVSGGTAITTVEVPAELEKVLGTAVNEAGENYVARIGTEFYDGLKKALESAQPGDTVYMLADFVNNDFANAVNLSTKNGVTLDGSGHKIVGNVCIYMATAAEATSTVNNVVFENIHNDRVVSDDTCERYGWKNGKVGMQSAIFASELQGTANITNCVFNGVDWDAIQATPKAGSTLNIIGNTFMHTDEQFSQLRYIHVEARGGYFTAVTVNVNGNNFYKTKHRNDPEITSIGIWYASSKKVDLKGNFFEYNPLEEKIDTNAEVPGDTASLFPARATATATVADVNPVAYLDDVAYLTLEATPAAYYGSSVYNTLQEAIEKSEKFYLLKDNNENVVIPERKNTVIYLKDFKLNGKVVNNGELTISTGTNVEGTATIENNGILTLSCNAATGFTVINNGTLKITGGSIYDFSKITNNEGSVMEISGGTFTTEPDSGAIQLSYKTALNVDGTYGLTLKTDEEAIASGAVARNSTSTSSSRRYYKTVQEGISNGAVHLLADANGYITKNGMIDLYCEEFTFTGSLICPGKTLYIDNGTAILDRIECGTFYGGYSSDTATVVVKDGTATKIKVAKNATVTIKGGTYTGTIEVTTGGTGSLTIKGGTFAADPSAYVPEGYTVVTNEDGTYTVVANN